MPNRAINFILKCTAPDLSTYRKILTAAAITASVKTSLVIQNAKNEPNVPFETLEVRGG